MERYNVEDIQIEPYPTLYFENRRGKISIPDSHIDISDILFGDNNIIYMGMELEEYPENLLPILIILYEQKCESKVTHETLHIVLARNINPYTSIMFDSMDHESIISDTEQKELDFEGWLRAYDITVETYDELVEILKQQLKGR